MTRPAATVRNRAVAKGSSLDTLELQALNSDMINGRLRIRAELSQACFGGCGGGQGRSARVSAYKHEPVDTNMIASTYIYIYIYIYDCMARTSRRPTALSWFGQHPEAPRSTPPKHPEAGSGQRQYFLESWTRHGDLNHSDLKGSWVFSILGQLADSDCRTKGALLEFLCLCERKPSVPLHAHDRGAAFASRALES